MIYIYRAKTMFHLLQILLLVNKNNYNILYLDGKTVNHLKENLKGNYFKKIVINKYSFESNYFLRYSCTILFALIYKLRIFFKVKNNIYITPQHNNLGIVFKEYFFAEKIFILEDGNYSYNEFILGFRNSLFVKHNKYFNLKSILGNYFLNINNNNINNYYYTNKDKLKENLLFVYNLIKNKILELDLINEIENLPETKKIWIKNIFFKDFIFKQNEKQSLILLTQPLFENGAMSIEYQLNLYDEALRKIDTSNYECYIKMHPRENNKKYNALISKFSLIEINKDFPFELLHIFSVKFDVGITFNSTAVFFSLIKNKIILDKSQANLFNTTLGK